MTRKLCLRWCVGLVVIGLVCGVSGAAPKRESRDQWQQPARVMVDLGLKSGMKVADIGCGRGFFTYRLARAVGEKGKVYRFRNVRIKVLKEADPNYKPSGGKR